MSDKLKCSAEMVGYDPDHIHECGWNYIYVYPEEEGDLAIHYTLGNHLKGLPELVLLGPLPPDSVGALFNRLIEEWKYGLPVVTGDLSGYLPEPYKLRIVEVDILAPEVREKYVCQLFFYMERHGWNKPFRLLQVLYPHEDETFGCECHQPLLPVVE